MRTVDITGRAVSWHPETNEFMVEASSVGLKVTDDIPLEWWLYNSKTGNKKLFTYGGRIYNLTEEEVIGYSFKGPDDLTFVILND